MRNYKIFQLLKKNMFFVTIIFGVVGGFVLWKCLVENMANLDIQIPESQNIAFNNESPLAMTTAQVANEFDNYDGKPILVYIYTTWCPTCTKNFSNINEIAREFQNTDLKVFALAIDRNIDAFILMNYLGKFGDFYFHPRYLAFKDGFIEFLAKKGLKYNGRIPFTVLISRDGKIVTKFIGTKNYNYLRNKIIREL